MYITVTDVFPLWRDFCSYEYTGAWNFDQDTGFIFFGWGGGAFGRRGKQMRRFMGCFLLHDIFCIEFWVRLCGAAVAEQVVQSFLCVGFGGFDEFSSPKTFL